MEWEMRPIEDEDDQYEAWTKPMIRAFGFDFSKELPKTRGNFEFDRTLGVIDRGEFVAATHAYSLEMRVPGNVLPMAGVSHVCVQASHRRRGIMTAMTKRQFQDFHDRGDPIAGLGRFGEYHLRALWVWHSDASRKLDYCQGAHGV